MAGDQPLEPLLEAIRDLLAWWEAAEVQGTLVGGVAASVLGRSRSTQDVDGLVYVDESGWVAFLQAGQTHGFSPRRPDAIPFALRSRVLLVQHEPTATPVDVMMALLPFESEVIERATAVEVAGLAVPLPTPEDLIIMKGFARRPKDWRDLEGLLDAHPRLDLARIRDYLGQFAEAMESPEILDDFNTLLQKRGR